MTKFNHYLTILLCFCFFAHRLRKENNKTYVLSNSPDSTVYEAVIKKKISHACKPNRIFLCWTWIPPIQMLWFNLTVTKKKLEGSFEKILQRASPTINNTRL